MTARTVVTATALLLILLTGIASVSAQVVEDEDAPVTTECVETAVVLASTAGQPAPVENTNCGPRRPAFELIPFEDCDDESAGLLLVSDSTTAPDGGCDDEPACPPYLYPMAGSIRRVPCSNGLLA